MKTAQYRHCPICNNTSGIKIINLKNTDLLRCSKCLMVFADIKEQTVLDKNVYDNETFYRYLKKEHFITAAYYDNILTGIIKYFKRDDLKMLEFGCGSGQFLLRAAKKGIDAYGSDFSPYSELAKKEFNLKIETENIFNTKYQTDTFDVIISHATYEHVYYLNEITEKLTSLLKKGGIMIISGVPNFNLLSRRWFKNYHVNTPPGHINYFEKKSIRKLFINHNLKPVKISSYGIDIWYIKEQARKIIGKKDNQNNTKEKAVNKGKIIVNEFKKTEHNVKLSHIILAFIYRSYGFFFPGKSIEAWAIKK